MCLYCNWLGLGSGLSSGSAVRLHSPPPRQMDLRQQFGYLISLFYKVGSLRKICQRIGQRSGVSLCFLWFNRSASVGGYTSQKPTESNLDTRHRGEEDESWAEILFAERKLKTQTVSLWFLEEAMHLWPRSDFVWPILIYLFILTALAALGINILTAAELIAMQFGTDI